MKVDQLFDEIKQCQSSVLSDKDSVVTSSPQPLELNLKKSHFLLLAVLDVAGLQGEKGRQMLAVIVIVIVMERPTLSGSDWSVKKHDCCRFGSIAC